MRFTDKVKRKLRSGAWYPFYNSFYERTRPDPKMIFLESRSGKALESNILAVLKELQKDSYRDFSLVLSVHRDASEEIAEKLRQNSLKVSRIVRTGSISYYRTLSQAGYLVNDTTFPGRFIKKEGQVYLNTWHGTPLKKMGRDNRPEAVSMGNVLRNLLDSDYLVFPNSFMEEKMSGAYMLSSLYRGTVLHEGYPRNDIFRGSSDVSLLEKAGLRGKRLITYLPTFRGLIGNVDRQDYMDTLSGHLRLWDDELLDNEVLLVKLHPFLHGSGTFKGYRHIRAFPSQWDTYEGLSLCDTLITDYSSVFYDFANAGKKIVLFAYDRKEYENGRGMYEDISSYPFLYTEDPRQVIPLTHSEGGVPDEAFLKRYATYEDGHGAEKICRHVFLGEKCCRTKKYTGNGKKNILIYGGDLAQNGITTALCSLLSEMDLSKYNYFLSFRTLYTKEHQEILDKIPPEMGIYPLGSEMNMDVLTAAALMIFMKGSGSEAVRRRIHRAYQREWKKHFGGTEFSLAIHYNGYEAYIISLFEEAPCPKIIWVHNDMVREIKTRRNQNPYLLREAYQAYDHIVSVSRDVVPSVASISGGKSSRISVIGNCHDYKSVLRRAGEALSFDENTLSDHSIEDLRSVLEGSDAKFISIGRFSPEKGHMRLIDAFDKYWKSHRDTWLIIIGGSGDLYEDTVKHARSCSASDHIILIRSMSNPMPVLKKCSLFLLSSYYEGQGLVMLEADTLGVPVMACDVSGPHSFLSEHGGILLKNSAEGLLEGMELFARGETAALSVDYKKANAESAAMTEELIRQTISFK